MAVLCLTVQVLSCQAPPADKSPGTSGVVSEKPGKTMVTPAQARNLIDENQDSPDFVILDIRTSDEFSGGHITGAVNLDYYQSDFKDRLSEMDKNKQYLVYCRTAVRSGKATAMMLDLGFSRIYDMSGGFVRWTAEGYPTVK